MADKWVDTETLYSEWAWHHARGYTCHSLLKIVKAIAAYRAAQTELRKAYNRLPEDGFLNLDWIRGAGDWDVWGDIKRMIAAHSFSEIPHIISNPRLSDRRFAKGSDTFPLTVWERQTRKFLSDAKKLNKAIDNALKTASENTTAVNPDKRLYAEHRANLWLGEYNLAIEAGRDGDTQLRKAQYWLDRLNQLEGLS